MHDSSSTHPDPAGRGAVWGISTDVVIFTVRNEELAVLLVRRPRPPFAGEWALPGGFLGEDEAPDDGARRALAEKTGMSGVYLEQLYTFGRPGRDPRGRVVTVGYFALIPGNRVDELRASGEVAWRPARWPGRLAFDHADIVAMARERLAAKLEYSTIALQLMPERFTLSQLQAVYEVILGESLDKRNFRKRVRGMACLEPTSEFFRAGKHRPARLYRLKSPGRVQIIK